MNDKNIYLRKMKLNRKTMELLLINYKNIHSAILKPCADKQKFTKLIVDLEKELEELDDASL